MKKPFLVLVLTLSSLAYVIGCTGDNSTKDQATQDASSIPAQPNAADSSTNEMLMIALEKLDAEQYDEAIRLFTVVAERAPRATHYALIGDCYWSQWKLEEADIHYKKALELDPKHCGANHALGRDAVLLKRYQDAISYLDSANELCAGTLLHAQNLRFRVEALLELGMLAEAEVDLKRLSSDYPENSNTYEAGLLVATKKGDATLAEEYQAKLTALANQESKVSQ